MASINSINPTSNPGMPPPPPMGRAQALTDDQKTQLAEILSKYDADNMTAADVQSMHDDIRNAGIRPGEELKTILEDAGFQVGPPQGSPAPLQGANRPEPPQFVLDFVDKALSGAVTEDDAAAFLEMLQSQNQNPTGLVIDERL